MGKWLLLKYCLLISALFAIRNLHQLVINHRSVDLEVPIEQESNQLAPQQQKHLPINDGINASLSSSRGIHDDNKTHPTDQEELLSIPESFANALHKKLVFDFLQAEERWRIESNIQPDQIAKRYGLPIDNNPKLGCLKLQRMGYSPAVEPPPTTEQITKIPNFIFQSWKTSKMDKVFCRHIRRWTRTNPDFHYYLFDDDAVVRFVRMEFGPVMASAFLCVKIGAARCDIWRLLVLYKFGGFYFDFDVGPRKRNPFRTWGIGDRDVVTGNGMGCAMPKHQRQLYGCPHQWGMIYAPRHPIIKQAILDSLLQLALRNATWTTDISFKPFLSAFWKFRNISNGYMPGWGDQMNGFVFRNRPVVKESMLENGTETHWLHLNKTEKTVYWDERCLEEMVHYKTKVVHNTTMTFCVPWEVNTDNWWTHHAEWEASSENRTHHCFQKIADPDRLLLLRRIYNIQWNRDCSATSYFTELRSSGFSADIATLVHGLNFALNTSNPFNIMPRGPWHFAANPKDAQNPPTCPSADNYCYWLQLSKCQNRTEMEEVKHLYASQGLDRQGWEYRTLFHYSTRPQTWLRRELFEFIQKKAPTLIYPYMAIHVRRGDVVLHQQYSRKYHTIREYMEAAEQRNALQPNILLLTDDGNAIGEALQEFPNYNWMMIDRPRFNGREGGFENHIPSRVPKHDLVAVLTTMKLVREARTFVYSTSGLAELLAGQMVDENAVKINLDEGLNKTEIQSKFHIMSYYISNANWTGQGGRLPFEVGQRKKKKTRKKSRGGRRG